MNFCSQVIRTFPKKKQRTKKREIKKIGKEYFLLIIVYIKMRIIRFVKKREKIFDKISTKIACRRRKETITDSKAAP